MHFLNISLARLREFSVLQIWFPLHIQRYAGCDFDGEVMISQTKGFHYIIPVCHHHHPHLVMFYFSSLLRPSQKALIPHHPLPFQCLAFHQKNKMIPTKSSVKLQWPK